MKGIYTPFLALIAFIFVSLEGFGQITCSIVDTSTFSKCYPGYVFGCYATETSPYPVTNRVWTLTTCSGTVINVTPNGLNPSYRFAPTAPGCYCLSLTSTNANGDVCNATQLCNFNINAAPTVNFTFPFAEGCLPLTATAQCSSTAGSGTISQVLVDWGTNCVPQNNLPNCPSTPISATFTAPGCNFGWLDAVVTVSNSSGCHTTQAYDSVVHIIPQPIARFHADTTKAYCATSGLLVHFIADSTDPNLTYTWRVDNVIQQTGSNRQFQHTFPVSPNCYDVSLEVKHPSGCSDILVWPDSICVMGTPVITFNQHLSSNCVSAGTPDTLIITNTTPGISPITVTVSGFAPKVGDVDTFIITSPGTYTITVTGTFSPGCTGTATAQLNILQGITGSFTTANTFSCKIPDTVTYNATPACPTCTYQWSGNSISGTGSTFTLTYNSFNTFQVSLVTTAANGCTSTSVQALSKTVKIVPKIGSTRFKGCGPLCTTLTDQTVLTNLPVSITRECWFFPDSNLAGPCYNSFGNSFNKCFGTSGCHSIGLITTTNTGCVDTTILVDTICVGTPPVCQLTLSNDHVCYGDSVIFRVVCDSNDMIIIHYGDGNIQSYFHQDTVVYKYQDTGLFHAFVIPMLDSCYRDTLFADVTIWPPKANFIIATGQCSGGDTLNLIDSSIGAQRYLWHFICIGQTDTNRQPRIVLPLCDTCTIALETWNDTYHCTNEMTQSISTVCNVAAFAPQDTEVCIGRSITFYNTSLSTGPNQSDTRWDFDISNGITFPNNNGLTGTPRTATFSAQFGHPAGTYTIAMQNTSLSGCKDTAYGTVRVCEVIPDFSNNSACYPDSICFTNLTTDVGCTNIKWLWNFGPNDVDSTRWSPCHEFPGPGTYNVTLTVWNSGGCVDSIMHQVIVSSPVTLSYSVDTFICPNNQICISNNSTGIALTYNWTIPGASPQSTFTTPSPCFTYTTTGDYLLKLHFTSNNQCAIDDSVMLHVQFPVAGGYTSATHLACPNPPTAIQFYDTSRYADSAIIWDFGDGHFSTQRNPTHTYITAGTFVVRDSVWDKSGCFDAVVIDTITVDGPTGTFTATPSVGVCPCTDDSVHYNISLVNAVQVTLLPGCNTPGFSVSPINPTGTTQNPSVYTYAQAFCLVDSCTPQLVFGDASGCFVVMSLPNLSVDSPTVNFGVNNFGACVSGNVCFTDSTTYYLPNNYSHTVKWFWDFGDGSPIDSTSGANPCHFYANPGAYHAKLYIRSNVNCFDSSVSKLVAIPLIPVAHFTSDSVGCLNKPICFQDSSTIDPLTGAAYWVWDFGDNSPLDTALITSVCHNYMNAGYYTVKMCVFDSVGCTDCYSSTVRISTGPIADPGPDTTICFGTPVQLVGSGGVTCLWTPGALFSDSNSCTPTILVQNDTAVFLQVTDAYGCTATKAKVLSIAKIFAGFSVPGTSCSKDSVCTTDTSSVFNGPVITWVYNFGDNIGPLGNLRNSCHKYSAPGTYNVKQIVYDQWGCADSTIRQVVILPNPDAAFMLSDSAICSDEPVCVTDQSTDNVAITNWRWNFGDNTTATGANVPCHTYLPPLQPQYIVTLIVTDQNGCVDTAQNPITVYQRPQANFTWSTSCETDSMVLTSTSIQGGSNLTSCQWTFWLGSANPVIDNNCSTKFKFPVGFHDVQLIVSDGNGCADTSVQTVETDAISNISVYPGDTVVCAGTAVDYTVGGVFDRIVWNPKDFLSSDTARNITIHPMGNVTYTINASNGVCKAAASTFSIKVVQIVPLTAIAQPELILLGANSDITSTYPTGSNDSAGVQIDSIIWTPSETLNCYDCPNPIATPVQTTTYLGTLYYHQYGITCTNTVNVTIEVTNTCDGDRVYVPNTFTPNGDGLNDVFKVRSNSSAKLNYFRVFDRWGHMVFEVQNAAPNDDKYGWNGNDREGKKLNPAVYVYTFEIECLNGNIVTGQGNVTLVR